MFNSAMLELTDHTFGRLAELMYESVGLSFNASKKPLVTSRLEARLQRIGVASYEDYLKILQGDEDPAEFQMAVDLLTTNETYFFREPKHFDRLAEHWRKCPHGHAPRVWSAASSFGDEAYSVAMLLADLAREGRIGTDWSVLGTDISHRVLMSAKEAIYPQDRLRHVSPERMHRYCLKGEGAYEGQVMIGDAIRDHVQFGQLNLVRDFQGVGPFDVVLLRNVLIYFDPATKASVIDRVVRTLKPGGLFIVGTAEGRVQGQQGLAFVEPGVYRKEAPK